MLERIGKAAILVLEVVTGAGVLAIAFILLIQVFSRYGFQYPMSWPEEVAGFIFVWLIFLGAPLAYWSGSLIGIHIFVEAMPERARTIAFVVANLIVIVFLCFLIFQGIKGIGLSWNKHTTVLQFSYAWIYVPLPIGAAALAVGYVIRIFKRLREARGGKHMTGKNPI